MADIDDRQRSLGPNARGIDRSQSIHPVGRDAFTSAGMSEKCFGAFATAGPMYAQALGIVAHIFIESDYERAMNVTRGEQLFVDDQFAGSLNGRYARFILERNPVLNADAKEKIRKGGYRRPDLLLHDVQLHEFEEIKPGSEPGKKEGQRQVTQIRDWMRGLGLDYALGTNYSPEGRGFPILEFKFLGVPVEVKLKVQRFVPGLIVYFYCIRTDWGKLQKILIIGVFLAVLAFILGRVGIPGKLPNPMPVPVPPPLLPTPNPIPNPIKDPLPLPDPVFDLFRSLPDRTKRPLQQGISRSTGPEYINVTLSENLRVGLQSLDESRIRNLHFLMSQSNSSIWTPPTSGDPIS